MEKTKYVYPAQFINEDNGTVSVFFPDLDGCYSYDDTIESATIMAKDALEGYIETLLEMQKPLPSPTNIADIKVNDGCVMLVVADIKNMNEIEQQTINIFAKLNDNNKSFVFDFVKLVEVKDDE